MNSRISKWQGENKMSKTELTILQVAFVIFEVGFFIRLLYFLDKRQVDDIIVSGIFIALFGIFLYLTKIISDLSKKGGKSC
jgi:hypothetical protein